MINLKIRCKQSGIDLIKKYEELVLHTYRCEGGVLSIGYGHTKDVKEGMKITEKEAEEFLKQDLLYFEYQLNQLIEKYSLEIKQREFNALCSFCYNVGMGNFRSSTMFLKLREKKPKKEIAEEFFRWVYVKGKKSEWQKNRREAERRVFLDLRK